MRQLSDAGQQMIQDLAQRHGFSADGVTSMLYSVINGNGSMAQFSHPDFSGSGQWMRGGMTMVSDMFNNSLKWRVDSLCQDLSNLIANEPNLMRAGSFQSQSQGSQYGGETNVQTNSSWRSGQQQQDSNGPNGAVSLFVPATRANTGQWWPEDLGQPSSTGGQNNVQYAYFPYAKRLAVNANGKISVYDTLDHQIGGFSQQQSSGASVTFTSQYGLVNLLSLPIISGESVSIPQQASPAPATPVVHPEPPVAPLNLQDPPRERSFDNAAQDIFATIEKLAGLVEKGFLTQDEYAEKKKELLSRL